MAGRVGSYGESWLRCTEHFLRASRTVAELAIQYADYAVWQRQWLQGEVLDRHLSYWKHQLSNLQVIELLADRPRPAIQSYRGAKYSYLFSRALSDQLQAVSRKEGALCS